MTIPKVLPGSIAEDAVKDVTKYFRLHPDASRDDIENMIYNKIQAYGGDPVTARVASSSAGNLIETDPQNAQLISENIVGTTIADPSFSGDIARNGVKERLKGVDRKDPKTFEQQENVAVEETKAALDKAGVKTVSDAVIKNKVHNYMKEGLSPEDAAAAATAFLHAEALASSDQEGFNIFGYLTLSVYDDVSYIFKSTENIEIATGADHTHLSNTTYSMDGHDFHMDAFMIKTTARAEDVRARPAAGVGTYTGVYLSYSTLSITTFHVNTLLTGLDSLRTLTTSSAGANRIYIAGWDNDNVGKSGSPSKDTLLKNGDKRVQLLSIGKSGIKIERAPQITN